MYSQILLSYWASTSHMYFCVGDQLKFTSLFMFNVFLPSLSQSVGKRLICFSISYNNLEENCGFKVQNLTIFAKSCVKRY
jgi:hypothetical protein